MAVKKRLLAEECPLCKENTLYTFTRKIVCVTMYAIYMVRIVLMTRPETPLKLRRAKMLAGAKNLAKVASSAKKISTDSKVVTTNKIVKYIFFH